MRRLLLTGTLSSALLLGGAGTAQALTMPDSTKGTKRCGTVSRNGFDFRVYVTKGKRRVSCRKARSLVRRYPSRGTFDPPGWRYTDWTKGGNGPWSDVYERRDRRAVVGAIIKA